MTGARSRAYKTAGGPPADPPRPPKTNREKLLSEALAQACLGREEHAEAFSILALRYQHQVALHWEDAATGECGALGVLDRYEVVPMAELLYAQIRKWREGCDEETAEQPGSAEAVGA